MTSILPLLCAGIFILAVAAPETKAKDGCDLLQNIEVTVKDGVVRGTSMTSEEGQQFCVFLGIPYAQPPIGHLRFKSPQPVIPWRGVLNTTKDVENCLQPSIPFMNPTGIEDCLYLNVYTPKLKTTNGTLLPVMVFIAGGGFYMSTGSISSYQPHLLMDKEILIVTFNYRVAAFGFLSTGDDESPGNYGLKDQVAVLRWVRDNIEEFGGNPKNVTIMGQSSGGASVHYHMLSPMTKGLFQNAISMDGTLLTPWAIDANPKEISIKVARLVGCPTEPSSDLVDCLRQLPAKDISGVTSKLFTFYNLVTPGFSPVVEKQSKQNPKPYLIRDPLHMILNGSFQQVPWLMGSNAQSSAYFLAPIFTNRMLHDQSNEKSKLFFPKLMLPDTMESTQKQSLWHKITQYYGIDPFHILEEQEMLYIDVTTDRFFIQGINKAAQLHALAGHRSIYRYNLAYRSFFSTTMLSTLKNYGVSHSDELRYLFYKYPMRIELPDSSNDLEVRDLILTMWTNFAKFGNPTPPKSMNANDSSGLLENLVWEPIGEIGINNPHIRYLNIGQVETSAARSLYLNLNLGPVRLNMAKDLFKDRMEFWDSLPLRENLPCPVCKAVSTERSVSSVKHIHAVTIVICMVAWSRT